MCLCLTERKKSGQVRRPSAHPNTAHPPTHSPLPLIKRVTGFQSQQNYGHCLRAGDNSEMTYFQLGTLSSVCAEIYILMAPNPITTRDLAGEAEA